MPLFRHLLLCEEEGRELPKEICLGIESPQFKD